MVKFPKNISWWGSKLFILNIPANGTLLLSSSAEFPWASGGYHSQEKWKVERKPPKIYVTAFVSFSVKHELISQWNRKTWLACTCLVKIYSCSCCWFCLALHGCCWWNLHNLSQKMKWKWGVSITTGHSSFTIWILMGQFSTPINIVVNELIKHNWKSSLNSKSRKGIGSCGPDGKIVW